MVLSHDIIEVVDKINGINIKMLSYIDFTNNYAELERVSETELKFKIKKLQFTVIQNQFDYLNDFLKNYLFICEQKIDYVKKQHPDFYELEASTGCFTYCHSRKTVINDEHWNALAYFNFDYWDWLARSLQLWNISNNSKIIEQNIQIIVNKNQEIVNWLDSYLGWFSINMIWSDTTKVLQVKANFKESYNVPLNHSETEDESDDFLVLANDVLAFNENVLQWARHYLNTNQLWTYDKKSEKWRLKATGQLVRNNLRWNELIKEVKWHNERKQKK